MLQCHSIFTLHPSNIFLLHSHYTPSLSLSPLHHRTRPGLCLAQAQEPATTVPGTTTTSPPEQVQEGPIELPNTIFATTDEPTPLQVATSVLLTGAITVFLFRAVRRRAKRARELKFRSSGVKKSVKEEALDSLKAISSAPIGSKGPPSPIQTFLGGIAAGVIALILYKFTTTIEAALNRQTLSDNFSVRQISITIRTIVNGLCYLATFVFGINSIGLFLLSGQLAINSFMEGSTSKDTQNKDGEQLVSSNATAESSGASESRDGDQSSEGTQ